MRRILFAVCLLLPLSLAAQVRIGFLSYSRVMKLLPEYAQAQEELADLKEQYDLETARGEEEFQRKFTEFLQGQKEFPQNILLKRQAELQSLMENGISFRQDAQKLLSDAEAMLLGEVEQKLDQAIQEVGTANGYMCILNTDDHRSPFINPAVGEDVTYLILQKLGLANELMPEPAPLPDTGVVEEDDESLEDE